MKNKKDIIDDLFRKRSEFNDPDQAETMSNLLDTVSSDIYSESQRFVFELIQNADDAAKDTNNEVHFDFIKDCLIVSHNGIPFSEDDIKALTSAGSSTKKADTNKTGYKGIGFKSVFGKSERVTIFSDGYQFRFDKNYFDKVLPWQIIPVWTEITDLRSDIKEAVLKRRYSVSTIIEIDSVDSLEEELKELLNNGQILLFLRRVTKISVSKYEKTIYLIEKKIINEDSDFKEVTLYKDSVEISSWITKTFGNIPVPEKTKEALKIDEKTPRKLRDAEQTEISFAAKIVDNKIKALKADESLIFTYLPTKVNDFNFPFLVNGSFLTNAAREGIHEDKIWNQWLFELIAEKILDWIVILSTSKYKFQILHLLPYKFISQQNELKKFFNHSFSKECQTKKFIITKNENVCKITDVVLDETGLSMQQFIDPNSITDFLKIEKKLILPEDCFVNSILEESKKLKDIGVETFEREHIENFFGSESFTKRHKVLDNFSLIKYLKGKSDDDRNGIWFQTLKLLPFIYDEKELLYNPSNGICFPTGLTSTELGEIPVIHKDIFNSIQNDQKVYDWLKSIGVKEPSQVAYVTNVIIPGLKDDNFINESNFIEITNYLFRLHRQNLLDEEMLECLREMKLKTKDKDSPFKQAQFCFLPNRYRPQLKFEGVIKDISLVSEEYLSSGGDELQWNLFFKAIKVKDCVEIDTINKNNSLSALKRLTNEYWVNECRTTAESKGGFGFGGHNIINSVKIPSYLNLISTNIEYSKMFWKNIISNSNNLSELNGLAYYKFGIGNGQNNYSESVMNYFPWFIKNNRCIPTTTKEILAPENVFINTKEIKEIVGNYLPVFDYDDPLPSDWNDFLQFKSKLEINDYLNILSMIAKDAEEAVEKDVNFRFSLKRIGLIYNKIASIIPDMNSESKQSISEWASVNKLLAVTDDFIPASQLKWITVEGFSTESEKLKVIKLPENSEKNSDNFKELISLFKVQTIDEFFPMFEELTPDVSLKHKLEKILPYYVALIEKKQLEDGEKEFERIYQLLDLTEFYSASEIKLSFNYLNETFDGPTLTVYKSNNKFHFKGKWRSERTLLSLIKELSNLLKVNGLNEELRFLLLETEEIEIREWLIEQGINLSKIQPMRIFTKTLPNNPTKETSDLSYLEESDKEENIQEIVDQEEDEQEGEEENGFIDTSTYKDEKFSPSSAPNSFDVSKIFARTKNFTNEVSKAETSYSKIQSQEVREDVGKWCEEFVNEFLINQKELSKVIWENESEESGKPFDFQIVKDGIVMYIDVKGTPSEIKDVIYLSPNEWKFMFEKKENYSIYRVYNAGKDHARIEIIENPASLLEKGIIFPNPITIQV